MSVDRSQFLEASRQLFHHVAHRNGAITSTVAAPHASPEWQREAQLVTPRVGALVSMAADRLGLTISERWFRWLNACPNNLSRDRVLLPRYTTSGEVAEPGRVIAPDQQAWVLISLADFLQRHPEAKPNFLPLLTLLADGLESLWDGRNFVPSAQNMWETTLLPAHKAQNFTSTLLLTSTALKRAAAVQPNSTWALAVTSMEHQALSNRQPDGSLSAITNVHGHTATDASLLAAWWPGSLPNPELGATLDQIDRDCAERDGLHPTSHGTLPSPATGGAWPLITAWRALAAVHQPDRERASQLLDELLNQATPTLSRHRPTNGLSSTPACAWTQAFTILALDALDQPFDSLPS